MAVVAPVFTGFRSEAIQFLADLASKGITETFIDLNFDPEIGSPDADPAVSVDRSGQQVTIGYDDRGGPPVLGDRVRVGANSVVLGPITIGDDAVIGAGAVVVRNVPAGAVVGGVPARILEGAKNRFAAQHQGSA